MTDDGYDIDNRLDSTVVPVMREAVATVQLVLFGQLKEKLASQYSERSQEEYLQLIGCVVNDLFGGGAQEQESIDFARKEIETVEKELWRIAENVPDLLPFLTAALRMQTLCDHEEGGNSMPTLLRARALGILQEDRAIPMPSTFMMAVRQLGSQYGLLQSMELKDSSAE